MFYIFGDITNGPVCSSTVLITKEFENMPGARKKNVLVTIEKKFQIKIAKISIFIK